MSRIALASQVARRLGCEIRVSEQSRNESSRLGGVKLLLHLHLHRQVLCMVRCFSASKADRDRVRRSRRFGREHLTHEQVGW